MPDGHGHITPEAVRNALRSDTLLVSVMQVNNEIGAVNDVEAIAAIVKKHPGTYFHTDITQGLGKLDIDLSDVGIPDEVLQDFSNLYIVAWGNWISICPISIWLLSPPTRSTV